MEIWELHIAQWDLCGHVILTAQCGMHIYGDLRTPYCTVRFTWACNSHCTVLTAHMRRSESSILCSEIYVGMYFALHGVDCTYTEIWELYIAQWNSRQYVVLTTPHGMCIYRDLRTPYCTVEFTTACNSHHTVWTAHIWRSENSILRSGIHVSM